MIIKNTNIIVMTQFFKIEITNLIAQNADVCLVSGAGAGDKVTGF